MINKLMIMGFLPCLLTACAIDNNQTHPNEFNDRHQQKGKISIPLTATSTSGAMYRLVLPEVMLMGEDEVHSLHLQGDSDLELSLQAGEWVMEIAGDWSLEKLVGENFVPIAAEMTSDNPQTIDIFAGETTLATISFLVVEEQSDEAEPQSEEPEEVEFQQGDLELQIEIEDDIETTEVAECSIETPNVLHASAGELLHIEWDMKGNVSEEVYVAVFSDWGETYYLSKITENDGHIDWRLPEDFDSSLEYHVYVEDAEYGERRTTCWSYTPLVVTSAEEEECSVEFIGDDYQAIPGETINIEWLMTGNISEQVYLSIHSEGGQNYYLSTIVENTGSFEWTLPEDLDPTLSYNIYVEDAETDDRRSTCWRYQGLDVVRP